MKKSGNNGAIFVDKKYVGRLARVIDADNTNRPGENTIYGAPHPEFPDVNKEVSETNRKGLIEVPANWIGRYVQVITT